MVLLQGEWYGVGGMGAHLQLLLGCQVEGPLVYTCVYQCGKDQALV